MNNTITTERLMDATEYELIPTGQGVWEWTEDGSEIGVRIALTDVQGETLVRVISHETNGEILLMERQIESRLRIAVDVMQFASDYNQQVWPFDELCEVLSAVDLDYGFSGSGGELFIHLGFGMYLDKEPIGYRITDGDGLTHFAGTAAGLRNLYPKVIANTVRRDIGWINRNVKNLALSEKQKFS